MNIHQELYDESVRRCKKFMKLNKFDLPRFVTYEECERAYAKNPPSKAALHDSNLVRRLQGGATVGMATGFHHKHPTHDWTVYVNLAKCAEPVFNPGMRRWSFPCWKTDRTAMGVVAHEVGHNVAVQLTGRAKTQDRIAELRAKWAAAAAKGKSVTGYELTLEESAAETLRLFILNPSLLKEAVPRRYDHFVSELSLRTSEPRHWREVLEDAPQEYIKAAERWTAL